MRMAFCAICRVSVRRYEMTIEIKRTKDRDASTAHVKNQMILARVESTIVLAIAHTLRRLYTEALNMDTAQHLRLREYNERIMKKEEHAAAWAGDGGGAGGGDENGGGGGDGAGRSRRRGARARDEGASSDEEAEGGADAGADEQRLGQRHRDDAAEYEGEEEEVGNRKNKRKLTSDEFKQKLDLILTTLVLQILMSFI